MKKPAIISLFTENGQTDIVEIIRAIFIIVVLAYVGWVAAGIFELQETIIEIGKTVLIILSIPAAYLVYRILDSEIAAAITFLAWIGISTPIVLGVPAITVLLGAGVVVAVIISTGLSYVYYLSRKRAKKEAFEEEQKKKGLVKFVDRFGSEKWGAPKEVEKWKQEDFEKQQIEKGFVKYKDKWVTPDEKEKLAKGFVKYVDRYGIEIWDKPAKIRKLKEIDEEERIKESKLYRLVEAIKKFKPVRKLKDEYVYKMTLCSWLQNQFPEIDVEKQIGASRPDIIIGNIGIEIKGPTRRTDQLDSIVSKCMRYPQHFEKIIVVLFDVTVSKRYFEEWLEGLRRKYPEVEVIRKD